MTNRFCYTGTESAPTETADAIHKRLFWVEIRNLIVASREAPDHASLTARVPISIDFGIDYTQRQPIDTAVFRPSLGHL
jgi:hypothetical protein